MGGATLTRFYTFHFLFPLLVLVLIILGLLGFSLSYPLIFIDADNWVLSNPIVTPTHIKPEWYFLFAYAILRCIPSKGIRVLILVLSITCFYILSFTSIRCFNFILLTYLRGIHVIPYYVIYAQYFSIIYFVF